MKKNRLHPYLAWITIAGGIACYGYVIGLTATYGTIQFAWIYLAIGTILITTSSLYLFIGFAWWYRLSKLFRKLCVGVVLVGMSIFLFVEGCILYTGYHRDEIIGDYVIVLGAGLLGDRISSTLQYRLDAALSLYQEDPSLMFIVSGGQGADEIVSEASAMQSYLIKKGIPEAQILMEDASRNTSENFQFSKALIDQQTNPSNKVTVITNRFHMFRALHLGSIEGLECYGYPADNLAGTGPVYYLREFFGVIRAYVLSY